MGYQQFLAWVVLSTTAKVTTLARRFCNFNTLGSSGQHTFLIPALREWCPPIEVDTIFSLKRITMRQRHYYPIGSGKAHEPEEKRLSEIIEALNDLFGAEVSDDNKLHFVNSLSKDEEVMAQVN